MYVQPYFPEPLTVPGNVASEPFRIRLLFLRRVIAAHALSLLVVAVCTLFVPTLVAWPLCGWMLLGFLLGLSAARQLLPEPKSDGLLSFLILLPVLFLLAQVLRQIAAEEFILIWPAGLASLVALVYAFACGNDFSFVGQFFISSVVVVGTLVCGALARWIPWDFVLSSSVLAVAWIFFYVYDLAALMRRRRTPEIIAATADLYRDILNFITYTVRVIRHWRRLKFF